VNEHAALEAAAGLNNVKTPVNTGTVSGTLTSFPTSPATYNGFIVIDTNPNGLGQVHYSRIGLEADFTTNTLSTPDPASQQFWYYDEVSGGANATPVDGSVEVSTVVGGISFDNPTTPAQEDFPLIVSGSVDLNAGPNQTITGDTMFGNFAGDSAPCGSITGNCASNLTYFAGVGTVTFSGSGPISTRIITDLD
jgi:hypothetical protein